MLSVLQMISAWRASNQGRLSIVPFLTTHLQTLCILIAWGALTSAYIHSDFSVAVVAGNSHTDKPLLYKITGVWGNHEGSMLLWLLVLCVWGSALAGRRFMGSESSSPATGFLPMVKQRALGLQGAMGALFSFFIVLTSNPFERIFPVPLNGRDLNPLLQDVGLAFHPPLLYVGYVGFSVVFVLTAAALWERQVTPQWAQAIRPWVMGAWTFLTAGICLGSWWAYYELGWGGFWFWDPVENASLMPWLAGTALIHLLVVVQKRNFMKHWAVLIALMTFSASLLGTFLVRSGVITSVHAFASSPERGLFILVILGLLVGGGLALYSARARDLDSEISFQMTSREGGLIVLGMLFTVMLFTVLVGTLAPVVAEALTASKISVGAPYYNKMMIPLVVGALLLLPLTLSAPWGRLQGKKALLLSLGGFLAVGLAGLWLYGTSPTASLLAYGGMAMGAWMAGITLFECVQRLLRSSASLSWGYGGMVLCHLGTATMLMGVTGTSLLVKEALVSLEKGESFSLGDRTFTLKGVQMWKVNNYLAERGRLEVVRGGVPEMVVLPERRRYTTTGQVTTEADIVLSGTDDIYVALGEVQADGKRAVRAWIHPLVSFLWGGMCLIVLGGICAVVGGYRRLKGASTPLS